MTKLFISLFLMVLASFVMFFSLVIAVENLGSKIGANADIEERLSIGTFKILDESLQGLNTEERESLIKSYHEVFGPEFALVEKSQLNFDSDQEQLIENHGIVVIDDVINLDLSPSKDELDNGKRADLIFRKHLETSLVWRIHLDTEVDLNFDTMFFAYFRVLKYSMRTSISSSVIWPSIGGISPS